MTAVTSHLVDVTLGLGEWAVSVDEGDTLVCLGLGSCVAFVAYDRVRRMGGMAHMVLPDSSIGRASAIAPAKFVDTAMPMVVDELERRGGRRDRFEVYLVGGARMLRSAPKPGMTNIGDRNAEAARDSATALRLRIRGQQLGGEHGRTVRLDITTGAVSISAGRAIVQVS